MGLDVFWVSISIYTARVAKGVFSPPPLPSPNFTLTLTLPLTLVLIPTASDSISLLQPHFLISCHFVIILPSVTIHSNPLFPSCLFFFSAPFSLRLHVVFFPSLSNVVASFLRSYEHFSSGQCYAGITLNVYKQVGVMTAIM